MEERIYIDPKEMLKGFDDGINCAMCVFGTMAPKLGFNREEARRIAALIGGGMGRSETCGCVTGAYMALGYKFANDQAGDVDKLNYAKGKREAFNKRFIEKFGSLNCCDMLGGLHNCRPEELAVLKEQTLYETICTRAVNYACAAGRGLMNLSMKKEPGPALFSCLCVIVSLPCAYTRPFPPDSCHPDPGPSWCSPADNNPSSS